MLAGSHVETQNHAGWLDGDVAAFCDEEGHFLNFMGSRSFVGLLAEQDLDQARDRTSGMRVRDALAQAGYAGRARLTIDPGRYAGYFEAHIEQGDTLESSGLKLGVVTAIVAIRQYRIVATGEQNHAGT